MFVRRSTYRALERQLEYERRSVENERRELLDRIMYLVDRPWNLPPPRPDQPKPERKERLYLDGMGEMANSD
jgi:hypothetical protein